MLSISDLKSLTLKEIIGLDENIKMQIARCKKKPTLIKRHK